MNTPSMKHSWIKIENWLTVNHPAVLSTLNNGAEPSDIKQLEALIGTHMPIDFKEFYSIHNGQSFTHLRLFDGDILLSIMDIINEWVVWKNVLPRIEEDWQKQVGLPVKSNPDPGIKDDWWNLLWIPITADGCGDNYCIDLDPTKEGLTGQIIRMRHDDPQRELISSSFREWIDDYVADLENNVYEASDDMGWGGVVRKG